MVAMTGCAIDMARHWHRLMKSIGGNQNIVGQWVAITDEIIGISLSFGARAILNHLPAPRCSYICSRVDNMQTLKSSSKVGSIGRNIVAIQ